MKSTEHIVLEFLAVEGDYEQVTMEYLRAGARGVANTSDVSVQWGSALVDDLQTLSNEQTKFEAIKLTGQRLTEVLRPAGWDQDVRDINTALDVGRRVVVTFCSDAPELYSLPWSTLEVERRGALGTIPGVLLHYTRARKTDPEPQPLDRAEGRVLMAWSAAGGEVPVEEQRADIEDSCRTAGVEFCELAGASLDNLGRILLSARSEGHPFQVLHLLCHGMPVPGGTNAWGLALNVAGSAPGKVGDPDPVNASKLANVLKAGGDDLRLVVLSACYSAGLGDLGSPVGSVAATLHEEGIRAVVASQFPLSWGGSRALTATLYDRMLVQLDSLEDAFTAATTAAGRVGVDLDRYSLQLFTEMDGLFDNRPITLCPDRGPLGAQRGDGRFVYQRNEDILRLEKAFDGLPQDTRMLFVTGEVGAGKSTAVLSGLVPRLLGRAGGIDQMGWINPGADPIGQLEASLARRDQSKPWLLVVDQLEEVFTHVEDEAKRIEFLQRIQDLATSTDDPVTVVATIRSDFVSQVAGAEIDGDGRRLELAHEDRHRVHLPRLEPTQIANLALEALNGVGLHPTHDLVVTLGAELSRDPDGLHQLAFVLQELWSSRSGRSPDVAAYSGIGRGQGPIGARADSVLAVIEDPAEHREAMAILATIAGLGERPAGQRHRWMLLKQLTPSAPERRGPSRSALRHLMHHRLVVLRDSPNGRRVELANDRLEGEWHALGQRLEADRPRLDDLGKLRDRLASLAPPDTPLGGGDLIHAVRCLEDYADDLDDHAIARIEASVAHQRAEERDRERQQRIQADLEREKADLRREKADLLRAQAQKEARTNRKFALAAGVVALLVACLGGYAWLQRNHARDEAMAARDTLRMLQVGQHASDRDLVAQLLREVEDPDGTPGWTPAVHDLLGHPVPLATIRLDEPVLEVLHTDDGRLLVRTKGRVFLFEDSRHGEGRRLYGAEDTPKATCLALSPDGTHVAIGLEKGAMVAGSLAELDTLGESFQVAGADLVAVHFVDDDQWLVRDHKSAYLAQRSMKRPPLEVPGQGSSRVTATAVEPGESPRLATAESGRVHLWSSRGIHIQTLGGSLPEQSGDQDTIVHLEFLPEREEFLAVSSRGTTRIWSLLDPSAPPRIIVGEGKEYLSAQLSPDGRWLALTFDKTHVVDIVDITTGQLCRPLSGHSDIVREVAFDTSSHWLASASDDGSSRVWELSDDRWQLRTVVQNLASTAGADPESSHLRSVSFAPDGQRFTTGGVDGTAPTWSTRWQSGNSAELAVARPPGDDAMVAHVRFAPDGDRAAIRWFDGLVTLHELDGARAGLQRTLPAEGLQSVGFAGSGTLLATVEENGSFGLWSWPTDAEPTRAGDPRPGHWREVWCSSGAARCVLLDTDEALAVVGADGAPRPHHTPAREDGILLFAALANDGSRAMLISDRSLVEIQLDGDPAPGAVLRGGGTREILVAPLAAYGVDGGQRAVALPPPGGEILVQPAGDADHHALPAHPGATIQALSYQGDTLTSAGSDGWLRLWDPTGELADALPLFTAAGAPGPEFLGLTSHVTQAGMRQIRSFDDTSTFRVWRLDAADLQAQLRQVAGRCISPARRQATLSEPEDLAQTWHARCQEHSQVPTSTERNE